MNETSRDLLNEKLNQFYTDKAKASYLVRETDAMTTREKLLKMETVDELEETLNQVAGVLDHVLRLGDSVKSYRIEMLKDDDVMKMDRELLLEYIEMEDKVNGFKRDLQDSMHRVADRLVEFIKEQAGAISQLTTEKEFMEKMLEEYREKIRRKK